MKYIISFFLTLSYFQIFSQNVIINYDFEDLGFDKMNILKV